MDKFIIGTRGSTLAVAQAEEVRQALGTRFPNVVFQLETIRTKGDKTGKLLKRHSEQVGFFTKELEEALLAKKIHIAVHSLKDLPTKTPKPLRIAAIPKRASVQDGLVTEDGRALSQLRPGSRIGTGSARRKAQLLHFNPSFEVVGIRGNLDTRIRKWREEELDALVLALAGLGRIGLDPKYIWPVPFDLLLPAPGQGALAVQVRKSDEALGEMVAAIDDAQTRTCVTAERAFLSRLGGGCQLPLGALATTKKEGILLEAVLLSEDGQKKIRSHLSSKKDPVTVGKELGNLFFEMGAEELLNGKG